MLHVLSTDVICSFLSFKAAHWWDRSQILRLKTNPVKNKLSVGFISWQRPLKDQSIMVTLKRKHEIDSWMKNFLPAKIQHSEVRRQIFEPKLLAMIDEYSSWVNNNTWECKKGAWVTVLLIVDAQPCHRKAKKAKRRMLHEEQSWAVCYWKEGRKRNPNFSRHQLILSHPILSEQSIWSVCKRGNERCLLWRDKQREWGWT